LNKAHSKHQDCGHAYHGDPVVCPTDYNILIPSYPELSRFISVWPHLPMHIRQAILLLAGTGGGASDGGGDGDAPEGVTPV